MTSHNFTSQMIIPANLPAHVQDCLKVVRGAVISRTENNALRDLDTAKKYRDGALKAFRTAYSNVSLTQGQSVLLMTATGLRHAQVTQFTREEMISLLETIREWFPRATKKVAKETSSDLVREVNGAMMDTEVSVLQAIVAGASHGDRVTMTVIKTDDRQRATLTWDRGGKKAHVYYDNAENVLSKKTQAHNREVSVSAMSDGRARRIARELSRVGGDETKLGKGDRGWLAKDGNRPRVENFSRALAN